MKNILPYILLTTAFLIGCKKSDLYDSATTEGHEVSVELAVSSGQLWDEVDTKSYGLTPAEEKNIKSLEILIFNSSERLVSRHRLETPPTLTNTIVTKSGSGMSIYVIANTTSASNGNGTPNDVLGMVTTVNDLKNIKVTNLLVDVSTNKTLMMYGVATGVTINPSSGNTISIPLNYVATKVTVNLYTNLPIGETFELSDWRLGSLSKYIYIFPQPYDVVNPSNPADYVSQSTGNAWSDGFIDVGGVSTAVKTTTFYVFENRRGVTTNSDPKQKSGTTAPLSASKFLAKGFYKTPISTKGIDIILMLGGNSFNDYNVERGKEYTYNVKVNGFDDINIETRYKDAGIGFEAEIINTTLDSHYDFRPIKIGSYGGASTVTILDENNLPVTSSFWLKVSDLNITKFVNNGSGVYVRPTYNPATDMKTIITYNHSSGSTIDSKMLYLYADEFISDNGTRIAKVVISNVSSSGTALAPVTYTITQRGLLLAGDVGMRITFPSNTISTTNYKLGIERFEEATMAITPGNLSNERTSTMQFGFSDNTIISRSIYTLRNGFDNTLNMTMSNTTTGALREPYGRTGASTISHQNYDPIFNTAAARYCFEKNRDTNGDGVIKSPEIKWYLPSTEEQLLIYTANQSWSSVETDRWTPSNIYNASSQYSSSENMATIYSTGITGTLPVTEPVYVRCVRRVLQNE